MRRVLAVSREEVHAARLALIATAGQACRPLDRELLMSGDGTAGRVLLGGVRPSAAIHAGPGPSCAVRSSRLLKSSPLYFTGPDVVVPLGGQS